MPPVLAGRTLELDDFALGLEEGPGSPNRATIFTGARGGGKTVMLSEVSDQASANGWIAADVTAAPTAAVSRDARRPRLDWLRRVLAR